jgi:uncharacterized protein (DUF1684 family)
MCVTDRSPSEFAWRDFRRAAQHPASLPMRAAVHLSVGVSYAWLAEIGLVGATTNPLVSSIWLASGLALVAAKAPEPSTKTTEAHRAQLMERLGIHDLPGLGRYALRTGLLSDNA